MSNGTDWCLSHKTINADEFTPTFVSIVEHNGGADNDGGDNTTFLNFYNRVGNIVMVQGHIRTDLLSGVDTVITMKLPVPRITNFSSVLNRLSGNLIANNGSTASVLTYVRGVCLGNSGTNDEVDMFIDGTTTTNNIDVYFNYGYNVL